MSFRRVAGTAVRTVGGTAVLALLAGLVTPAVASASPAGVVKPGVVKPAAGFAPDWTIAITRIAGADRDLTSVAASQEYYPTGGTAHAVVLASNQNFPDALAGAPLAVLKGAPLLLTTPGLLDPNDASEIARVLPTGGTVYILGGAVAVSTSVDSQITALGDKPVRLAGADRFGTAIAIAGALGNPSKVLLATGLDFPDGLAAGAAAGYIGAAVLLTNGFSQSSETAAYLAAHPGSDFAVGGPASGAAPAATPIVGVNRYDTAVRLAGQFFPSTVDHVGFASGLAFPDALSGGANIGAHGGPLLLVPSSGPLPSTLEAYLNATPSIVNGRLYGGLLTVGSDVAAELSSSSTTTTAAATRISAASVTGVSCASPSWCMAVDSLGKAITYANGTWSSPKLVDTGTNSGATTGEFDGVSCPSTSWCMAVSYLDGFSIYSGGTWAAMAMPPIGVGNGMHGVSCWAASQCATEADNFGDLSFYNAGSWTQPASPPNGIGIGNDVSSPISCAGSAFCLYVTNDFYQTATGGTVGTQHTIDATTPSSSRSNVSCTSATFCSVVFGGGGQAELWNGSSFSSSGNILTTAVDGSSGLEGVSCVGTFCAAVSDHDLYTTSNGSTWTDMGQFIAPSSGLTVTSLSCGSTSLCVIGRSDGIAYLLNPATPITAPIPTP